MAMHLFSVAQASRVVGRDPRTLRRWISEHPELCVKIGGRQWVRQSVLSRLLNGNESHEHQTERSPEGPA